LYGIFETIRDFLQRGGNVMVVLVWVVFIMWTLIIERHIYLLTENRIWLRAVLSERELRQDRWSWHARAIYDAAVSQLSMRFESGIRMIRTLARLCPLFGLMGTVTGMIIIFDVMATTGSSSPKAMAAGVAKATLTTMAGMVGALSGIFPAAMLNQMAQDQHRSLQMHLLTAAEIRLSPVSSFPKHLRLIISPVAAFLVTMGLIFLMQTLILTGEAAIQKVMVTEYVDFIRVRKVERIEMRNAKPKKIVVETAPEKIDLQSRSDQDAGGIEINYSMSGPAIQMMNLPGLNSDFGSPDGEFLPMVKIIPLYPGRARRVGIEGWVIVGFTITVTGTVEDVIVLESSNTMFEASAIRAVEKFKYKPRIVDGEPVAVTTVRHKVTYTLEE
jgi:biopolymer transport protein ExbB